MTSVVGLISSRPDFLAGLLVEHLEISFAAILVAIVVGGIAGILVSELARAAKPVLAAVNFLYTIRIATKP